jgi:hypothetical protein
MLRDADWYIVAHCQIDELVLNGEKKYFATHQKRARLLLDKCCDGNNDIVGVAGDNGNSRSISTRSGERPVAASGGYF